jgi:hypothetical protein
MLARAEIINYSDVITISAANEGAFAVSLYPWY